MAATSNASPLYVVEQPELSRLLEASRRLLLGGGFGWIAGVCALQFWAAPGWSPPQRGLASAVLVGPIVLAWVWRDDMRKIRAVVVRPEADGAECRAFRMLLQIFASEFMQLREVVRRRCELVSAYPGICQLQEVAKQLRVIAPGPHQRERVGEKPPVTRIAGVQLEPHQRFVARARSERRWRGL